MKRALLSVLLISTFCIVGLPVGAQGFEWAAHFSSTSDVQVNSVAHDPANNEVTAIIVFQGELSYNGGPIYTSLGDRDILLVRMDSDGDTLWTKRFGSTGKELPKDVTLDAAGNIYATGSFSDGADFGGTILNSLNAEDVFLVKVLTDGTVDWARNVAGGQNLDRGNSLIVDKTGNIHIIGFFKDSLIFENDTLVSNGKPNNFAAEYNNNGDFLSVAHFINTTVNSDRFNSISLAHDGGTLISGFFRDSIKYNDPAVGWMYITSVGGDDIVVFKFNQDEEVEWVRTAGSTGADRGYDATTDASGNVYLGGYFSGSAKFDSTDLAARDSRTINTKGGIDIFVAKYNSQGTLQWIFENGGKGEDIIRGVDLDQNLFHYAGHFSDTIITQKNDTLATTGTADQDIYFAIADLNSSGIAVGQTNGPGYETTQAMAYDGQGAEYLAGYFESATLEVGDIISLANAGGRDGVLMKYSFPFSIALEEHINVSCNNGNNGKLLVTPYFGQSPYEYDWSHDPILNDSVASGLIAGTYKVVVTDNTGEKDSIEVDVTQPTAIQIDKNVSDVSCYTFTDGEIDITASLGSPAFTYAWTTSNGSGLNPTEEDQTGLRAGDYTITVTDSKGCAQDSTFTVTEPTELTVDGFNKGDVTTGGAGNGWAKVLVSGGTPAYAYDWSNGGTLDSIYNLDGGTYNVEITDFNGCTAQSNDVIINEPGVLLGSMQLINHITCFPPYSYLFSSGIVVDDTIVTDLAPGWVVVTINDDGGGQVKDSILITEPAALVVTKTLQDASCYNICDGIIDINVTGGTLPYSYSWDRGDETEDLTSVCSGPLYTVTVTDANGCQKQNVGFVDQPDSIELAFNVTDATCFGVNGGAIELTVTGGTGNKTYYWSNTLTTKDLDFVIAGDYWVRVTDENGCKNSDTATVNQPDQLIVNAFELKPACFARTDGKAKAIISGGTSPYKSYTWNDPSAQSDSVAINLDPDRSYNVVVLDQNDCEASDTAFVHEQLAITVVTDSIEDVYCKGEATGAIYVTLSKGQEPYTYDWMPGNVATRNLVNVTAGIYTLEAVDAFGCKNLPAHKDTIEDFGAEILIGTQKADSVTCNGDDNGKITLEASGGNSPFSYSIDNGSNYQAETLFENLVPESYITVIKDANGCLKFGDILTVSEPTGLLFNPTEIVRPSHPDSSNGVISIHVIGGVPNYQYLINSGDYQLDSVFTDRAEGSDTISVIDANGCSLESIVVLDAFTPVIIDSVTSDWSGTVGTITIYATGESLPLTYRIVGGTASIDSTSSGNSFSNLAGGNYTVYAIDNVSNEDTEEVVGLNIGLTNDGLRVLLYPNPSTGKFTEKCLF